MTYPGKAINNDLDILKNQPLLTYFKEGFTNERQSPSKHVLAGFVCGMCGVPDASTSSLSGP